MITPEERLPAADMQLEPNALAAATTTCGNVVVTAGPGAGKTELLAQRADFLLRTGQCRYPRRILAISFKVDAAKNLKDRVRRRCPPELAARLDSYTFHSFAKRLIDAFRPVLTGIDALAPDYTIGSERVGHQQINFDAMAPLATTILETSPVARAALRHTYGFVFLDEFQDCTTNQYELVKAAFHDTDIRITAVGDAKQCIMGFAGALEGVLGQFAEEFTAEPLTLHHNFRARPLLRRMQNYMIRVMEPAAAVADADLLRDGGEIEVQHYGNSAEEARAIADRIEAWITTDGVPPDEIAILVRNQVGLYTEDVRAELRVRGLPFREEDELQNLSAEPVAMLILDFLAVVTGDREPDAYTRLMDAGIGWRVDDDLTERSYADLRDAVHQARREYSHNQHGTLHELVDRFLEVLGDELLASLAPQYQQGTRLKDVIEEVHTHLDRLYFEVGDVRQALREFAGSNAVKLMTVHKAKGLEFDVVIVLAVEQEMFFGNAKEARSAYFVAISRARKTLCLTACQERRRPSASRGRWDVAKTPHKEFLGYALSTE